MRRRTDRGMLMIASWAIASRLGRRPPQGRHRGVRKLSPGVTRSTGLHLGVLMPENDLRGES